MLDWLKKSLGLAPAKRRRLGLHTLLHVRHLDKDGNVLFEHVGHNLLHDEGEELFCNYLTGKTAIPANLYLGLDTRVAVAEDDALTDLTTEPSGDGYARSAIVKDTGWTVQQDSGTGDWEFVSTTETFTASGGDWGAVTRMFLTTESSGTAGSLIATEDLSQSRTIQDGESLEATITVRLKEAA